MSDPRGPSAGYDDPDRPGYGSGYPDRPGYGSGYPEPTPDYGDDPLGLREDRNGANGANGSWTPQEPPADPVPPPEPPQAGLGPGPDPGSGLGPVPPSPPGPAGEVPDEQPDPYAAAGYAMSVYRAQPDPSANADTDGGVPRREPVRVVATPPLPPPGFALDQDFSRPALVDLPIDLSEYQVREYGRRRGGLLGRGRKGDGALAGPVAGAAPGRGLARTSGVIAAGTIASRVTGFLRTAAIAAAIGTGALGDAYNVANTTPNILYDLLLGGVLSSVIVPVVVRAAKEDDDGGERFASSLLTLVTVTLGIAVVVGVAAAPGIVSLYTSVGGPQRHLTETFSRWFLPQVLFYGVGATVGAILNVRGSFAAPMITPVLNNLVVIGMCVLFIVMPGPRPPLVGTITSGQTTVLAVGTTLGVVVMTLALFPSLRRVGFRFRPRLDVSDPRLRGAMRLAGWVFLYVAVSQVGYSVIVHLATGTTAYTTYTLAFQLFQLPHAIVAVSVITALLPRMSAHAAEGRLGLLREDLAGGMRLAGVVLIPAALGTFVLARPIAVAAFRHGAVTLAGAQRIGDVLAVFAIALVPFSVMQLQLRAFYALQDTKTPALVNVGTVAVQILSGFVLSATVSKSDRGVALAVAFALSYLVGAIVSTQILRRRLHGVEGMRSLQLGARVTVAGAFGAVVAAVIAAGFRGLLGSGAGGSFLGVIFGGGLGVLVYVWVASRMRIAELDPLVTRLRARVGR